MATSDGSTPKRHPMAQPSPGEEIVISGIAGRFPDSDDVLQFQQHILNKADLTSDDERRWKNSIHVDIPRRSGKINKINKFDASFFGIPHKQANSMDPLSRMVIEKSYEAVIDAGCNPKELRGSKTGVFIGVSISESEKTWMNERPEDNKIGLLCTKFSFSSLVSYYLGLNGPSCSVDTACSSSVYAMEHAYTAIRQGRCEAALVAGMNLCLHPYISLQFSSLGVLSPDGRCKTFDESANGYSRSEACSVIYLQKAKNAKRIYCTVVHVKTNCDGFKEEGITFPSSALQYRLLKEFYEECDVDPSTVAWIEAHGTGTKVGDPQEVKVLENVFCKGRNTPLPIGSVKSNIGHSEPASCICSVIKVIISMETGIIPPNINFSTPRADIDALHNGKISVISEQTPWDGTTVGINSFGFGGANGHILLKRNEKNKAPEVNKNESLDDVLPYIVVASGRTQEAVEMMLKSVEKNGFDKEHITLLYEIHKLNIPGHYFRGYLLHNFSTGSTTKHVQRFEEKNREVWFLFKEFTMENVPVITNKMMQLPGFAAVFQRCHKALLPYGINFFNIISGTGEKNVDNPSMGIYLRIAAIQIGLIKFMRSIDILPHKVLGFSVGEFISAYADKVLSVEQTIVAVYYFSLVQCDPPITHKPATNDLTKQIGKNKSITNSQKEVEVNGLHSSAECDILNSKENGLGLEDEHSKESQIAEGLFHYLRKIISKPKLFSDKFMTFCPDVPEVRNPVENTCSPEYFKNSLATTPSWCDIFKLFKESSVVIDFSFCNNDFDMKTINSSITYISLCPDNLISNDFIIKLFYCLGRFYEEGLNPIYSELYPKVALPVSRGTPYISPYISWDYSQDWFVAYYSLKDGMQSAERTFTVSLKDDDLEYLSGHLIDGRNLFPATGYLELVWELAGSVYGLMCSDINVVFKNVMFHRATNIPKEGAIDFHVTIQRGSGNFQVVESRAVVVTGNVSVTDDVQFEMTDLSSLVSVPSNREYFSLTRRDIYKELWIRGYNYKGLFKSLVSADSTGSSGKIAWYDNWVAFMDNMLQMDILHLDSRYLLVPVSIEKLTISSKSHFQEICNCHGNTKELPVHVFKDINLIKSGGIEIKGLNARSIPRKKVLADPVLERYEFLPYSILEQEIQCSNVVRICIHIILENIISTKLKVLEAFNSCFMLFAPMVVQVLGDLPLMQGQIIVLSNEEIETDVGFTVEKKIFPSNNSATLVIIPVDKDTSSEDMNSVIQSVSDDGFIICREDLKNCNDGNYLCDYELNSVKLMLIFEACCQGEKVSLFKKTSCKFSKPAVFKVDDDNLHWVPQLQQVVKSCKANEERLLIVSQGNPLSGIIGFTNCIRKEPGGEIVSCLFIMDENAPEFSLDEPFYQNQVKKGLAINILNNGVWGSYRHLPLSDHEEIFSEFGMVDVLNNGDLSSLTWLQISMRNNLRNDEALVYIYYSAINFRDIMMATGRLAKRIKEDVYSYSTDLGFEYSGRLANGQRVMGMCRDGGFSTAVIGDTNLMWDVPESWTLEDAATVPIVYSTVICSVFMKGRLTRGETILIHAGSGGVGLAAITMALYSGCTVFTSVGSNEKREFIKSQFPQLTDSHIGCSRDSSFEQFIMKETKGRGVDVVLNSLAEDKLQASIRCLAKGGRFLEIGRYDLERNSPLGMQNFKKLSSFHGVMLDVIFNASENEKIEMHKLLLDALKAGAVKPLQRLVFNADQHEEAFRFMGAGKHIGKVLIKIREEEPNKIIKPYYLERMVKPQFHCKSDRTYLIVGGLGGFGLELIDWLITRGAKNLVITSRNGIRTGYQARRVRIWRKHNIKVEISTLPLTSRNDVKKLLMRANKLGPVAGVFNLAVVLHDSLFDNMNMCDFDSSFKPKSYITSLLDQVSREMCLELEQFVVFSSVSCGRGNAGQTNYGMTNSIMERICEKRRKENFHGLAIQWGAVGDVGLVADMQEENVELVIGGTLQQKIRNCLEVLDVFLLSPHAIVSSMVVAEKRTGFNKGGNIIDTICHILGIRDRKTISVNSTLTELGMDSMTSVEIKQMLEQQFEIFLTSQDIRVLTLAKLQEMSAKSVEKDQIASDEVQKKVVPLVDPKYFLMRVIGEEKLAKQKIVKLPSLSNSTSLIVQENTVIFLPGIEGSSSVMKPLAKNLLWRVFCLQFTCEHNQSITSIAENLVPEIKMCIEDNKEFVIVGYSFGSVVALELVYLLEKEGYKGRLLCLDGSPDYMKSFVVDSLNGNTSDDNLQRIVLSRIASLLWPSEPQEFSDKLDQVPAWEDRINLFSDYSNYYSKSYQKESLNAIYCRLKAVLSYQGPPEKSITSPITLIRPTDNTITHTVSEDYGLSKFCTKEINIHVLEGNHVTILENEKFGNILYNLPGV